MRNEQSLKQLRTMSQVLQRITLASRMRFRRPSPTPIRQFYTSDIHTNGGRCGIAGSSRERLSTISSFTSLRQRKVWPQNISFRSFSVDPDLEMEDDTVVPASQSNPTGFEPLIRTPTHPHDNPSLQRFVQAIRGNVQQLLDAATKIQQEKNESTSKQDDRKSIQERWQQQYDKEMQRYRRRNRRPRIQRLPVDQSWEQELRLANLPSAGAEEEAIDSFPSANVCENPDASAEKGESALDVTSKQLVSPIFALPLNEQLRIDDMESLLSLDNEDEFLHIDTTPILKSEDENPSTVTLDNMDNNEAELKEHDIPDAVYQAISLLTALDARMWKQLQSVNGVSSAIMENSDLFFLHDEDGDDDDDDESMGEVDFDVDNGDDTVVEDYLRHAAQNKQILSTTEANLLLAHLVVSPDQETDGLMEQIMCIYEEMKLLSESGQIDSQPDATTYRILILALRQRLMATGEAIRLSREMMHNATVEVTPEVFLEAMKACHAKVDLKAARVLMEMATEGTTVRPSLGSYLIFIEMLKVDDLRKETISFFQQLHMRKTLSPEAEDKVLHSICRWPRRTRRGDFIDLSAFLIEILSTVQGITTGHRKPGISLWVQLVGVMHVSARTDPSLWAHIKSALYTILESYPQDAIGNKLLHTGLRASVVGEDPNLAAALLNYMSSGRPVEGGQEGSDIDVQYQIVKSVLEVCRKARDTTRAESIMESIERLGEIYPPGIMKELHALLLLSHAEAGEADEALSDLADMTEKGMQPGEDLYGAVLRSFAATGRQQEAEMLFQAMENGTNGVAVKPGSSSYDAMLFGRIKDGDWEGVISLYESMQEKRISSTPETVERLLSAHAEMGGTNAVVEVAERLLQDAQVRLGEVPFRSLSGMLLPEIEVGNFNRFRQSVRRMGEENTELREASVNLIRSLRVAEIESERPPSRHKTTEEMQAVQDQAWKKSVNDLLEFAKLSQEKIE